MLHNFVYWLHFFPNSSNSNIKNFITKEFAHKKKQDLQYNFYN